ncbi:hypothetical protein AAG906_010708 [Vitis piasezkii]
MTTHEAPRVEVPKPHHHFEAIVLTDEAIKVCTTTLNLIDNAILWWRRRFDNMQKDIFTIETKNMRRLKHTGSIHHYVKKFSSLMLEILEIPDMIEEELLFNFMDNLQGGDSSKVEYLEDSHTTGGGNEVSRDHNAPRMGLGKTPNVQEGRGKVEKKEFTPKMKCFMCDGPHWAQDCPKRKTLSAMIEERE